MNESPKKHTWSNLIWQPVLAVIFLWVILLCLDELATSKILWAVGAGSLASSTYIVFGKPFSPSAAPWRVVGGYLVGILTGGLMRLLTAQWFPLVNGAMNGLHIHMMWLMGLAAALAVGLSLVFMVLLKLEHPPAAGMALVLVLDVRDTYVIAIIIAASIILSSLRYLLRKKLRDLV